MRVPNRPRARAARVGGALVPALVVVLLMSGMTAALMQLGLSEHRGVRSSRQDAQAFYLAEAAVADALAELAAAGAEDRDVEGALGSAEAPILVHGGSGGAIGAYWASLEPDGPDAWVVTTTGESRGRRRSVRIVVTRQPGQVFTTALYAGNKSRDPRYVLRFSGENSQADQIHGDVYSGGSILVEGHAVVHGEATAYDRVLGHAGEEREGVVSPPPDLDAMDYEVNHTFDVATAFDGPDAYWAWDQNGGNAWQLPEASPAHIFRKNPTDRSGVLHRNGKDDYFLEDPYEPVRRDVDQDGSDPNPVTVTGTLGNPGPNGNRAVYFVDGNLWVHNSPTFSFRMEHDFADGLQVTFVVKGNITFSDNVFYQDAEKDGIAFIAIEDPDVEDSGNVYFGDPEGGTLEYMDGYMYAENDFYDVNLTASGSRNVQVNGMMSAGDQIAIERGLGSNHTQLVLTFDPRVRDGDLDLPGIPDLQSAPGGWVVGGWMEVSPSVHAAPGAEGEPGHGDRDRDNGGGGGGDRDNGGADSEGGAQQR